MQVSARALGRPQHPGILALGALRDHFQVVSEGLPWVGHRIGERATGIDPREGQGMGHQEDRVLGVEDREVEVREPES